MTPGGMINSASEYQFVTGQDIDAQHPHGDLDRIIIDGGIMPLRSSSSSASSSINWKNCLRGEDIAFLDEACFERLNAMGVPYGVSYTGDFRRMVEAIGVHNTRYHVRTLFERSGNGYWDSAWIKNGVYPTSPAVVDSSIFVGVIDNTAFLEVYQGYYFTLSDAQTPAPSSLDRVLRRSTIEAMFSDISKLYCLCLWEQADMDYIFYKSEGETTPEYSQSVAIKFPTNQYISRFENYGIGAFTVRYRESGSGSDTIKYVLIPMNLSSPPTPRDITATAFSLIGISDYEAPGFFGRIQGSVAGYFGELRNRTRWT